MNRTPPPSPAVARLSRRLGILIALVCLPLSFGTWHARPAASAGDAARGHAGSSAFGDARPAAPPLETLLTSFTVNLPGDDGDGTCDSTCTLRDAVTAANNAASDDTIGFAAGLTTVTLASDIVIASNGTLSVTGPGAHLLTIDGGQGDNRIFSISQNAVVTIAGVTLTGGGGGGAISNGPGGAIYTRGTLTLDRVHVTGNTAGRSGGGVAFFSSANNQILNSTFSNNNVTSVGKGAAFETEFAPVSVVNSTFSGNTASGPQGGAIVVHGTTVTLRNSTVTGNTLLVAGNSTGRGGGVYVDNNGALDFGNTVIAGNAIRSRTGVGTRLGVEIFRGGAVTSAGFNLVGDSAGDAADTGTAITYQSTDILDTNPQLAPLRLNAPGTTPTHALSSNSPALDKGSSFGATTDQRGAQRPFDDPSIQNAAGGGGADIGAFEGQSAPPATTPACGTVVNNTDDSGAGSLRGAIGCANALPGADTITFNIPGAGPHTISPAFPLPEITGPLTVDGLTQPGASCAAWPPALKVVLAGNNAGAAAHGLDVTPTAHRAVTVRGLVINRFGGTGISIIQDETHGATEDSYTIQCNFIGTDATGTVGLGNAVGVGLGGVIFVEGDGLIGGTTPGTRNLVSGNGTGLRLVGGLVQGNFVGTDVTGTLALGNDTGISVRNALIGGTTPEARNIISGNTANGISTDLALATGQGLSVIQGNYIGTDVTGAARLGNGGAGILLGGLTSTVGGTDPAARNVISANGGAGVVISGEVGIQEATGNAVSGNYIGTDATGTADLGNGGDGVLIVGGTATVNLVGGPPVGLGGADGGTGRGANLIAFNGRDGVRVEGGGSQQNSILYNSIHSNAGLGINLGSDGVTPNDAGDADTGPNNLQNFPVLTAAVTTGTSVTIQGTFNSQPNRDYTFQFFSSPACDSSGSGEGRVYLGEATVKTDGGGTAAISVTLPAAVTAGHAVTSTATFTDTASSHPDFFSTSEFSACLAAQSAGHTPTPTPTPSPTPQPGVTMQFSSPTFSVAEGCVPATLTVMLTGAPSGAVAVDYTVTEGTAKQKTDFTYVAGTLLPQAAGGAAPGAALAASPPVSGTLTFLAGETEKEITVLINEDGFAEGTEDLSVTLSNPRGAALGAPATAALNIDDNETADSQTNPIDEPATYVCQLYHDFLHRQPDPAGLAFWTEGITRCGPDAACVETKRHDVAAAFFLSIEFQQTGYFVYRAYEAGLDRRPQYEEFMRDLNAVGLGVEVGLGDWQTRLANQRRAFAEWMVGTDSFKALFPAGMTAEQFADKLFRNADASPTQAERQAVAAAYGAGDTQGRAQALIAAMEAASVYNRLYNPGFVLVEYFGFMRRDPDDPPDQNLSGFDFWLQKMDSFTQAGEDARLERDAFARIKRAEMVRAFIIAGEYRRRFGP